jgi:hypothetical protein
VRPVTAASQPQVPRCTAVRSASKTTASAEASDAPRLPGFGEQKKVEPPGGCCIGQAPEPRERSDAGSSPRDIERSPVFAASSSSAVEGLTEAVLEGERFIALTGEPGVSRSAIVDALVIGLVDAGIKVVRVRNSAPGPLGVGRLVVLLLGGRHTRGADDDLHRVLRLLTDRGHHGKRLICVIEDADKLEHAALGLLKLLPELHREESPRAQILLVGRPGLWTLLAHRSQERSSKTVRTVAPTTPVGVRVQGVDRHQVVGAEGWLAPRGAFRLLGARGASWFLSQVAGRPAARALLVIVFAITGVFLVAYHGSLLRPGPSLQEATSRSVAGGGSASTPMIATTSANGFAAGRASQTGALSGENPILPAISGQQVVRSAFPPAVAGSTATRRLMRAPSQMRAEGDGLYAGTANQVRHEPPQAVLSLELVEPAGNGGSRNNELGVLQRQNQNEMDVDSLFGGGISPPYPGTPSALILFRGQVHNTAMHRKGKLSVAIVPQGSSGAITARFDAGAGLLGPGELAGNLSEGGHVSAHGRLMVGDNAFFCYLRGSIIGNRLIGSARFVRSNGGRVTRSSFTLIRS